MVIHHISNKIIKDTLTNNTSNESLFFSLSNDVMDVAVIFIIKDRRIDK